MMLAVIMFLGVGVSMAGGGALVVGRQSKVARNAVVSKQSLVFVEGALEDLVYRARTGKQTPSPITYTEGSQSVTITFTDNGDTATIVARGGADGIVRAAKSDLQTGAGNIFNYAVHIDTSGIEMESNARINGNVYTNGNVEGYGNSVIAGDTYAAGTISSPSPDITGVRQAGAPTLPVEGIDVDWWKAQANRNNDPHIGNLSISGTQSLGPKKIVGNLTLNGNAKLTITGPIHVTGNLEMQSNSKMYIAESFVASGTAVVVDGSIGTQSNNNIYHTTGTPHGYLMLVSLSSSGSAVEFESNAEVEAGVYAPNGTVRLLSNGHVASVVAKGLRLESNAVLDYDLGIRNIDYSGGPSGGWEIGGWGEVE